MAVEQALAQHLRQALGAGTRSQHVVVFVLNLAAFRVINDALGETAGDDVLREAARRLNDDLEAGQFVACRGGDHFFGIVHAGVSDPLGCAAQAERTLARLSQPIAAGGTTVQLQAKIGIAYSEDESWDPEVLCTMPISR